MISQKKLAGANENMHAASSLISRNITIMGRRTSVRLEPEMWAALKDIAHREGCSMHEICSLIHLRKREQTSLTAGIRVFLMLYYKAASTDEGHRRAGHGDFENMRQRARISQDAHFALAATKRQRGVAQTADLAQAF